MLAPLKGGPIELRDRQFRCGVDRSFAAGDSAQPQPALGRTGTGEIERQVGSDRVGARDRSGIETQQYGECAEPIGARDPMALLATAERSALATLMNRD